MKLEHAALWTPDLERSRRFYEGHFGGRAGPRYRNPRTGFSSYFLSFGDGSRLELMHRPDIAPRRDGPQDPALGLAHLAFQAGSRAEVQALTQRLRGDGCAVVGEPRLTGDGYYESVVLDPDGNRIEITTLPGTP
jgi:lactoylglutathione lyase